MSEVKRENGVLTIIPEKDIVSEEINVLKLEIIELIEEEVMDIVLDLKSVNMIDSSGIGVIITTRNSLAKSNKKLKVINIEKDILRMFKIMKLERHFEIEGRS